VPKGLAKEDIYKKMIQTCAEQHNFPPSESVDMDHTLIHLNKTHGRKLYCSLEYALSLKGTPFKENVRGGLEFPYYETYALYFERFLRTFKTISATPQYKISRSSRMNDTSARWPDFAIIRSMSERNAENGNWIFMTRIVLAVVEIKPLSGYVSSDYDESQVKKSLESALSAGQKQARMQAKYLFAGRDEQKVVFAIYGAGPFWKYEVYERDATSPPRPPNEDEETYVSKNRIITAPAYISPLQKLGTKKSATQFRAMLVKMKKRFSVSDEDW